ncbi:hypothetical protein [Streptomyces sp. NPDC007063]|uniref:hypothetical protein n=1 Tax=Streptomyces sp. NPDC007063 TaxID=3364772 RepID=UPI0036BC27F1
MSRRTDDYDRSARIINSALEYGESPDSDVQFAGLVVNAMLEQGDREDRGQYPPAGHDYPRR